MLETSDLHFQHLLKDVLPSLHCVQVIIIIIIIYNLYRGKAPVTGSDFQGGPLRVKIKYVH